MLEINNSERFKLNCGLRQLSGYTVYSKIINILKDKRQALCSARQ